MNERAPSGDAARAEVFVAVPPDVAFEIFTAEIDRWWGTGPRYRMQGRGRGLLCFEPGVNGRLFETYDDGKASRVQEIGRVTVWEPGARLEFEWRNSNFTPDQKTIVDVRFAAEREGTRVTVHHHGWSTLPAGHPARHGIEGAAFSRRIGMWWGQLFSMLREHVLSTR